jgi:transcriptional regulator with XRE-family HTH domain
MGKSIKTLKSCIGIVIREKRQGLSVSQVKLAKLMSNKLKVRVWQSYISKIESGRSNISFNRLALISQCLGCKPSEIVAIAESRSHG